MSSLTQKKPLIIAIIGPTASGKTKLAVSLAKQFNGEIVSADSRQVYRGLDIGSGKDLVEYGEVPYHLIDIADPKEVFDLACYQQQAFKAIDNILARKKLPIICGGSGLYLQAIIDNYALTTISADQSLRNKLEQLTLAELQNELKKLQPTWFNKLSDSDQKNKRRLIRYLEIAKSQTVRGDKKPDKHPEKYKTLVLGLAVDKNILAERIEKRLHDRLDKEEMIEEVKNLHEAGVSWERLESFGLEYKFIAQYLQDKIDLDEMIEKILITSQQFAKRQMTWFKRWEKQGREIKWIGNTEEVFKLIENRIAEN